MLPVLRATHRQTGEQVLNIPLGGELKSRLNGVDITNAAADSAELLLRNRNVSFPWGVTVEIVDKPDNDAQVGDTNGQVQRLGDTPSTIHYGDERSLM